MAVMATTAPTVDEVGENRVRLTVEVSGHDVKHAVEHAASDLAGQVKIPGFRKGRVPMPVLLSRVGKERLMAEAIESHIAGWFWNAAARSRIRPVSQPDYAFDLPDSEHDAWRFTATVDVQPKPVLADWRSLEVPKADVEVPPEALDEQLEALQRTVAELVPVEGRPVQEDDTVVVDLVNEKGEIQKDYVAELGAGRLVDEIEQGLLGMQVGETKEITFELADDATASVSATINEIKEKVLPPLGDDLARAASEFDTLAGLRADIEGGIREQLQEQSDAAFRTAAVDRLAEASAVEAAGPLVESRTRELVNGLVRSVERRGVSFDTYLALTGASAEELVARMREEAQRSVARELVLDALADELGIEVADDDVEALVREQAADGEDDADAAILQLREGGGFEQLREDLRLRRALDRLVDEVQPIGVEVAAAREAIWTPEKEKTPADTKLWTPGSKEPA
jgi:trigger factor